MRAAQLMVGPLFMIVHVSVALAPDSYPINKKINLVCLSSTVTVIDIPNKSLTNSMTKGYLRIKQGQWEILPK